MSPRPPLKAGLVDVLAYEDQLDDTEPLDGTRDVDAEDYANVPARGPSTGTGGRIALLYAVGVIASGKSSFETSGVVGSDTFNQWLRKVRVDPGIRAVVVRVDSPGGSAVASEVMWRELMLTRDVKPLIVSMGNVAASGGYYIAAPAHVIVADPGTLTGSIGVVTGKFVMQGRPRQAGRRHRGGERRPAGRNLLALQAVLPRRTRPRGRAAPGRPTTCSSNASRRAGARRRRRSTASHRDVSGPGARRGTSASLTSSAASTEPFPSRRSARSSTRRRASTW